MFISSFMHIYFYICVSYPVLCNCIVNHKRTINGQLLTGEGRWGDFFRLRFRRVFGSSPWSRLIYVCNSLFTLLCSFLWSCDSWAIYLIFTFELNLFFIIYLLNTKSVSQNHLALPRASEWYQEPPQGWFAIELTVWIFALS